MRRQTSRSRSWTFAALIVAASLALLTGCTIIRKVPGGGGGGGGGGDGETEPKVVDVLVQTHLRRSAANLSGDYETIVGKLAAELSANNVEVRGVALAPMYRRHGGTVPLLWGRGADNSQFSSIGEAIRFYTRDDGATYLTDEEAVDGENLASLGMKLDTRSIYHPSMASPDARAYFSQPKDGLVVVSLTAAPRRCNAGDAECQLNGQSPGKFFTKENEGAARWLSLPGGGLPTSKTYHAAIVTAEGIGFDEFADACRSKPNFPQTRLDVMQPSEEKSYFGPLTDAIDSNGGHASRVPLCDAMSANADEVIGGLADDIASSL
jgi:hypothetical protein